MTPDPAPAETLKLLPESTAVLRFVYISDVISKMKSFHLVFYSNFAPLRPILLKIIAIHDLLRKKRSSV